jgi:hypothetical protein
MAIVYALLVGHFVADFVCQSDWMAVNKSKRIEALCAHVIVYTAVLCMFAVPFSGGFWPWMAFGMVNGIAHFVQDAITSRLTSRLWFFKMAPGIWAQADYTVPKHGRELVNPWVPGVGNRHWFFVAIGFDQLLHYVTLFVTAGWWLR